MMRRYVSLPRSAHVDDVPDAENYLSRTVFKADPSPQDTGLLDAQGNRLYAINEMDPIGFVHWTKGSD